MSHCHTTVFIHAVFIKYEIFRNHAKLWFQNRCIDIDRKNCYNLSHTYYVGTSISHLFICGLNVQTSQPDFLTILANVKETEKHKHCIFLGSFVFLIASIYICVCIYMYVCVYIYLSFKLWYDTHIIKLTISAFRTFKILCNPHRPLIPGYLYHL